MKNRIILFVLAICITTASLYGQQTSSASHLPVMDLNNPIVSAMPSNVDVTPMGAASYSIPIQVPPGTNGFQPNISISYNSQAGLGAMGIGWNISGVSQIERGGKNFYHDGPKVEKNHITFTDEDQLYLDGQRLILLSGKHLQLGAVYGFEVENYARVTIKQIDFQQSGYINSLYLELKTKEGAIIQYGVGDSQLWQPSSNIINNTSLSHNTLCWKISKSIDVNGNVINYEYSKYGRTLQRITYANGANCIEFKYIPNDKNPQKKYIKDFLFVNDSLLSSVRIKQGGVFVDKYMFNYEVSNTFNRLVSVDYYTYNPPLVVNPKPDIDITKLDTPISSPIIVMENPVLLSTTHVSWGKEATLQSVDVESDFVPDYDRMYIGDIDGDGSKDYVFLNYNDKSDGLYDNYLSILYKRDGSVQKIPFDRYGRKKPIVLIQDIDLDGQEEVVLIYEKGYLHLPYISDGIIDDDFSENPDKYVSYEKHLKLFAYNKQIKKIEEKQDLKLTDFGETTSPYYLNYNIVSAFFSYVDDDIYPDLRILIDKESDKRPNALYMGEYVFSSGILKPLCITPFETVIYVRVEENTNWNKSVLGDFDSNGILDLLNCKSGDSFLDNMLNYSNKFHIVESGSWRVWRIGNEASSIGNDWIEKAAPYAIDINSDNRTDLLIQYHEKDNHSWKILKSNGLYSSPNMESVDLIEAVMTIEADNDYKLPIDYNGDGLMDFVVVDECHDPINKKERRFSNTKWWFYKNDNGKLVQDKVFITNYEISYKSHEERHPVVADINNDGVDDVVYYENGRLKAFTMYGANKTNLVNSITDGVGRTYQFDYKYYNTLGFKENTELQYAGDFKIFKRPFTVVASINWNGKPQIEYSYGKMLYNVTRGLLGFDKISRCEIYRNTKIYSNTQHSLPGIFNIRCTEMFFEPVGRNKYFNMMLREKSVYNSINSYSNDDRQLESTTRYTNTNIEIDRLRYIPVTTKEVYYDALTGQSKTVNHTYETNKVRQKGNLLRTIVITGKNTQKTEYSDFVVNVNGIADFLPKTQTVTYSNGDIQNNIVYKTRYQYNNKYQIVNSVEFADKPENISTVFDYYPSGNLRQKTVSVPGLSKQTTTYHYDHLFRLPVKVVNSVGQYTQNTYDYRNGNVLTSTDIDGSTTHYTYNIAGQLKTKTSPNGQRTSYNKTFAIYNDYDYRALYKVTETLNEPNMVTTTYYDIFDREVYKTQTGANGILLHSYKRYNYKNQLEKISGFHEKSESNPPNTYYIYDDYNRLHQQKVFDGVFTNGEEYSYSGNTITVKDAIDQTNISTKVLNSEGLVESSSDRGGDIRYTYDAQGRPLSIKANGATTEFKYDVYGNRTYIKDPNAGAVTSEYFANGLIRKHTNAKGDITTYEYDALHRVSKETITEATGKIYTFEYKYTPYGEIADVVYKEGGVDRHRRTFAYNKDNLLESVTDTYEGNTYKRSFGYDKYWRLIREVSPSGLVTENSYDRYGNISEVKVNGSVVWTLNSIDAKGKINRFTLGNKSYTDYTYMPNGLLKNIRTKKFSLMIERFENQYVIQNVLYDYDRKYNLIRRNDLRMPEETFKYDNTDRLIQVEVHNVLAEKIEYGINGNIEFKTGVGEYLYNSTRPHAMSGIRNPQAGVSSIEQRLEYNAFNKVTLVEQGGVKYGIFYGLDRERIKTEHKDNGKVKYTRLYFGSYEKDIAADGTETHVDYVYTPSGLTAINKRTGKSQIIYYVHNDNIGSVSVITDEKGEILSKYYYSAWGRRIRTIGKYDITDRGYTGHEHLTALSLINMNGRIYDPVLARFLSPDPYVQAPDFTQNYNRYAYCLNNPFKYTDPSGELFAIDDIIIGAMIGAFVNAVIQGMSHKSNEQIIGGFFAGGFTGAGSAALGGVAAAWQVPGIFAGAGASALTGAGVGALSGFTLNGFNNWLSGNNFFDNAGIAALSGGLLGGITGVFSGGIRGYQLAKAKNLNMWWGNSIKYGRTKWSFFTSEKPHSIVKFSKIKFSVDGNNTCVIQTLYELEAAKGGKRTMEDFMSSTGYTEQNGTWLGETPNDVVSFFESQGFDSEVIADSRIVNSTFVRGISDNGQNIAYKFDMKTPNIAHMTTVKKILFYQNYIKIYGRGATYVLKNTSIQPHQMFFLIK